MHFFFVAAFGGTIIAGSILDPQVQAMQDSDVMLSYGQAFALGTVPICTLLGAAIGFAFSFSLLGNFKLAAAFLFAVSAVGWSLTSDLWSSQIEQHGPDPTEIILYYPPTTLCLIAVGLSVSVGLVELVRLVFLRAASFVGNSNLLRPEL